MRGRGRGEGRGEGRGKGRGKGKGKGRVRVSFRSELRLRVGQVRDESVQNNMPPTALRPAPTYSPAHRQPRAHHTASRPWFSYELTYESEASTAAPAVASLPVAAAAPRVAAAPAASAAPAAPAAPSIRVSSEARSVAPGAKAITCGLTLPRPLGARTCGAHGRA